MLVICVIQHATKHISISTIYKVRQESIDNTEFLVTNDMDYVTWVSKAHFMKLKKYIRK